MQVRGLRFQGFRVSGFRPLRLPFLCFRVWGLGLKAWMLRGVRVGLRVWMRLGEAGLRVWANVRLGTRGVWV